MTRGWRAQGPSEHRNVLPWEWGGLHVAIPRGPALGDQLSPCRHQGVRGEGRHGGRTAVALAVASSPRD